MYIKTFLLFFIAITFLFFSFLVISFDVYSDKAPIIEENTVSVSYVGNSRGVSFFGKNQLIFRSLDNEEEYFNINKSSYFDDCKFEKGTQYSISHIKRDVSDVYFSNLIYSDDVINYYHLNC